MFLMLSLHKLCLEQLRVCQNYMTCRYTDNTNLLDGFVTMLTP